MEKFIPPWYAEQAQKETPSAKFPGAAKGFFWDRPADPVPMERADTREVKRAMEKNAAPRAVQFRSLESVQMKSIDWLWTGWIPQGYITIWAGETGAGKSTVLADVAARVTTGAAWPGEPAERVRPPAKVLWLGSEDGIEELTLPRLVACGANLGMVCEIQGVVQAGERETFSLQDDMASVSERLRFERDRGTPVALLVIDPVTSYLPGKRLRKVDLNDAGQLRSVLEPWLAIAQEHRVAIVCVTHFAKDTNRTMLHRVLGSAAFAQTCRSLCAVVAQPESGQHAKVLIQVKVNLPERPDGAWKFHTVKVDVDIDPVNKKVITATKPEWDVLDPITTPESLTGGARGPISQQAPLFATWLHAQFEGVAAGDMLPIAPLKAAALSELGITSRWWDDHSAYYLLKENKGGVWVCRLKVHIKLK